MTLGDNPTDSSLYKGLYLGCGLVHFNRKPIWPYISLSPGHPLLQGDVLVENIVAMYEAGLEYGRY